MYIQILILCSITIIISVLTYLYIINKVEKLIMLDKRQHAYITNSLNSTVKLRVILQLLSYILFSIYQETSQYGKKQLRKHFNIEQKIINDKQLLIKYFVFVLKKKRLEIQLENCKYTIK